MYIYADESGHSGKHIFNEPEMYLQGAILSVTDPEPILTPVAEKYRQELGVSRLHAKELKQPVVERIASTFLSLLWNENWIFHVTAIEKPYLSVTKFVDSIFDSFENKGARWLWYNHEYFRHTLCCLFDYILTEDKKQEFWTAYLKDDHEGICLVVKWTLGELREFSMDKRLKEVATDGLSFALKYPEEITLLASVTKRSYRGHTPNMVAFSSLIHAVHAFCKANDVVPRAFYHDSQSEFASTMREYHKMFSGVRAVRDDSGMPARAEKVDYDLGKFSVASSRDLTSLQACDLFLWLLQRVDRIKSPGLRKTLMSKINPFYISRASSKMTVLSWNYQLSSTELTEEQLQEGRELIEKLERTHKEKLDEFESRRLLEDS